MLGWRRSSSVHDSPSTEYTYAGAGSTVRSGRGQEWERDEAECPGYGLFPGFTVHL